jgi:alkaline phosphatase D
VELTRRRLIAAGGAAALASSGPFPLTSVAARRRRLPLARGGRFSSGVAAGQPATDGALLWTRLDGLERTRLVTLEVARDPEFKRVLVRRRVKAQRIRDFTARHRLRSRRLRPDEEYFYRFETRTTSSRVGRFKTLPPQDSRQPIRIAYFSCQRYEHGYFTPQAGIAADEDLDLVVSLGDYIYEEDSSPRLEERRDPSGQPNGHTETLAQFRSRYRTYRSDPNLQDMHARHALYSIWDDCEVEGNWAGDQESSGGNRSGPRRIPFAEKRLNGFLAYFEWMPFDRSRRADRFKVYDAVRLGSNVELVLLDTRQFRDPQPCGDRDFTGGPCLGEDELPRRLLGDAQKAWLKERLAASRATWKVLANAQMMMALDIAPGQPVAHDSWDGYAAERREVLEYAAAQGVQNLTSIVGDVHVFFAGDLYTSGRIDGRRVGTEFVGASVSHDGFSLPEMNEQESALLTERLPLVNPHLKYASFGRRGYAVLEARPEELRVEFRTVPTVLTPRAESRTLQRFRVASGVPVAELA